MLADNLVMLRNLKGLTQEQVAEVIGISRQSYAKWEQGETIPDIEKCDKLAKFYGISIDALIHQNNAVGQTRIAPAPIGKVVLGDDAEGIALIKSVDFENKIQEAMRLSQQKAEEKE